MEMARAFLAEQNIAATKIVRAELVTLSPRLRIAGRLGAERVRTELNWEKSVEQLLRAYETVLKG